MNYLETEAPKPTKGDVAHTLAKAGLSAIPVVGGPAAEIFSMIIVPPLTRRRDEWVEAVAKGLKELEAKVAGFKIETLRDNEIFITTVMHATQAAIRNHQREKLEALRNAVINSALGIKIDQDTQQMFLEYLDSLTPSHLKILSLLDDPQVYGQKNNVKFASHMGGSATIVLEEAIPELSGNRSFYDQLLTDLFNRGLINTDANGLHSMMTDTGMFARRTTDNGRAFLTFIACPV